jgi:hypothetical protein
VQDHEELLSQLQLPTQGKLAALALMIGVGLTAVITLLHGGTEVLLQTLMPPVLNVLFAVTVLSFGKSWVARRRFMASRPDRSKWTGPPSTEAVDGAAQSADKPLA